MAWTTRSNECLAPTEIDAYVRGVAEPSQRQRVLAHIGECMRCSTMIRVAQASAWDASDYGAATGSSAAGLPSGPSLSAGSETMTFRNQSTIPVGDLVDRLHPGDDVLGYRLQALLGKGGMGLTWRAQRQFEAEPVALKILPDHLRAHQDEMDRVKHVFNLIKSLRHPAIAMVFQLCEHPRHGPVLIMELVDGMTLRQLQTLRLERQGTFTIEEMLQALTQVADALDYAHANRVVHRDVKPSNLMLRPDCTGVKLIDFGLGDEIRQSVVHLSLIEAPVAGTAPYMAPEQWRGHAPSAATDQYALGCVAYEMLAGHPPFVGTDTALLRSCHLGESIPTTEHIPPRMFEFFWHDQQRCALAKSRENRFSDCRAFISALRKSTRSRRKQA